VIVSLPNEIGQLKALKSLSLKNNHIQVNTTQFSDKNPQPIPAGLFVDTLLIDLNLHGNNKLTSTDINQFEGFDVFLKRRKSIKDKNLHGGAMVSSIISKLDLATFFLFSVMFQLLMMTG
jgi:Leucine-rich repeat (LRR) protein